MSDVIVKHCCMKEGRQVLLCSTIFVEICSKQNSEIECQININLRKIVGNINDCQFTSLLRSYID